MKNKTIKEISLIAATWWGDKICNPEFDNGATDIQNILARTLAETLADKISREVKEKFILELSTRIEKDLIENQFCNLFTDYDPNKILREAAVEAGVPSSNFPWKTNMDINYCKRKSDAISIKVSRSNNHDLLIYANDEYYKSKIKENDNTILRNLKENSKCIAQNLSNLEILKNQFDKDYTYTPVYVIKSKFDNLRGDNIWTEYTLGVDILFNDNIKFKYDDHEYYGKLVNLDEEYIHVDIPNDDIRKFKRLLIKNFTKIVIS